MGAIKQDCLVPTHGVGTLLAARIFSSSNACAFVTPNREKVPEER